jgi:hypothetical protein
MPSKKSTKRRKQPKKRMTSSVVKQIAKSVILNVAESKYFNTEGAQYNTELTPLPVQLLANMTCYGFSTGSVNDPTGTTYQYGSGSMKTLNLNRLYGPTATAPLNSFALEGMYCSPSFSQSRFIIERTAQDFSNPAVNPNRACPYFVRILRIQPRPTKTSNQEVQPNLDAFLTVDGLSTGVFVAGFSKLDILTLKPNTRKYKVIQDIKYMMNSPVQSNALAIGAGTNNVSVCPDSNMRSFNFTHDIGKKLFYKEPSTGSVIYPTAGFKNEFILFHFQAIGDDSVSRTVAQEVRISANAVSTFKDV